MHRSSRLLELGDLEDFKDRSGRDTTHAENADSVARGIQDLFRPSARCCSWELGVPEKPFPILHDRPMQGMGFLENIDIHCNYYLIR